MSLILIVEDNEKNMKLVRDILQANRDQLLLQSQHLREALQAFETALAQGDSAALQALITAASQSRAAWSLKR